MTETIKIITGALSASIPLLGFILTLVIKLTKNIKAKKAAQNINFFVEQASKYVQLAERFANYSGPEKKEYVQTKINQESINSKIPFDLKKVSEIIEKTVQITKEVNKREKDKEVLQ